MSQEEILALDSHFDFDNTYNQNKWSLYNFLFLTIKDFKTKIIVDGKELIYNPAICVYYREWQNEHMFPLIDPSHPDSQVVHTSVENAQSWLEKMIHLQQYTKLDRVTALELAEEKEKSSRDYISFLAMS